MTKLNKIKAYMLDSQIFSQKKITLRQILYIRHLYYLYFGIIYRYK